MAYTKIANTVWISEAEHLRKNIAIIDNGNDVQSPILFFISNGKGTSQKENVWRSHSLNYLSTIKDSQYELLDYPHNLHQYIPEEISRRSNAFISKLQS